ncbi:hypothetical protein NQZ68_016096 [Dissostichus eleginoides]|nr:hypothetical protein NQZ68_016096 [Dissostichus eleginoides]
MAAIMLLSVFFVSGALASCPEHAQPLVTTPQEMEALSGACLQIPCNFSINAEETFDSTGPTSGLWIKSDYYYYFGSKVVFNGNMMENIYPMSLTGDLSQKDCSTLFSSVITSYTGSYLFRIDNRPLRRKETCDPLQIKVKDSPPSPRINISNPGDLKEAESVTVTCSAPAPCPHSPPKLTWTLQQNPPNTMEENPDRTFTTKIQKTLTLTDQHDGFNITCSASYPVNEGKDVKTTEETMTLHVSYAPKDVMMVVSPADPVSVGSVVNLTCSCRGIPAADSFAWLMMMSDGRLHMMEDNTQLYVFEVTNTGLDQGALLNQKTYSPDEERSRILNMVTNMLLLVLFVSDFLPHLVEGSCYQSLDITTPKQMEALSGSCLLIPCNFSAVPDVGFNSSREIFGVWIKKESAFAQKPNNVIFHSDGTINRYPMNITGNLRQRNCTTLFSSLKKSHTDKYFFRIENSPFLATAACDPLQITVKDSPPSPTIEIPGDLKEAESVTVTCSAPAPCPHSPPKLTWTLQQNPPNTMEENPDRTFTTKIQKTLTLTDQHDGFNITCSASYPVNEGKDVKTAEETKTLHVSYAPKDTSASVSPPSGSVSAGSWLKLSCSSRAQPPVSSFTWFKESQDGDMNVSQGEIYSFNATEGGRYYCVATNALGEETSPKIHLAKGGAEQLHGSSPWGGVVGGIIGIMILICFAVAVWWLKSKHTTQEQSQQGEQIRGENETQINDTQRVTAVQESAAATETGEEIHYGEIDFSKQRNKSPPVSEQDGGQTEDTLYAQVKVSETANRPEDLYAQVKRK